jgi:hypothetical protein
MNPETGGDAVKKVVAVLAAVVFAAGSAGLAYAQTQPAAEKKADGMKTAGEKKTPAAKKPMARNASGTVKSASADSVVVAGKEKGKDTEWTFAVDPKTKVRKANKDMPAGDLKAGDPVQVRYVEQEGKAVAQSITVAGKSTSAKAPGRAANPCAAKPANPCAAKPAAKK